MTVEWEPGFAIRVNANSSEVLISGNKEGLLSLSRQLAALAEAAPGSHIHYDRFNSLEDGSPEMVIERIP